LVGPQERGSCRGRELRTPRFFNKIIVKSILGSDGTKESDQDGGKVSSLA
jgi:hypothetical protein